MVIENWRLPTIPSFVGSLPTPRFYPNSVWSLNTFLWMPLLVRSVVAGCGDYITAMPHVDEVGLGVLRAR